MNKQTKLYLGIGLVAVAGYMIYNSGKKNFTATKNNCITYSGNSSVPIGTKVENPTLGTSYIVRTGGGRTIVCKQTWGFL
jgi:hypothetical protein